jgi:hypothetical protein
MSKGNEGAVYRKVGMGEGLEKKRSDSTNTFSVGIGRKSAGALKPNKKERTVWCFHCGPLLQVSPL